MTIKKDSLGFLMADVSRLMRNAYQEHLKGGPLTVSQARLLVNVSLNEGIRQVDLAKLLEVKPMTLARLVDGLEEAGVVIRRTAPSDRRAHHIYLTPDASLHLDIIQKMGKEVREQALKGLNKEQTQVLTHALETMRHNLFLN